MHKFLQVAALALLLPGCAFFTKPLEQPVIEEKLNPAWLSPATVGTLSLTPERRVVLVNFRNNRFCAEAPTEVGLDLANALKASVEAARGDAVKIGAAIERALTAQNQVLNRRTQGMQLFLANAYFTCQMYMNGGLDERQMLEMQFQTLKIVEPLIAAELPYLHRGDNESPVKPKDTSSNTNTGNQSNGIKKGAQDATDAVLQQKSARPEESPKPATGN